VGGQVALLYPTCSSRYLRMEFPGRLLTFRKSIAGIGRRPQRPFSGALQDSNSLAQEFVMRELGPLAWKRSFPGFFAVICLVSLVFVCSFLGWFVFVDGGSFFNGVDSKIASVDIAKYWEV